MTAESCEPGKSTGPHREPGLSALQAALHEWDEHGKRAAAEAYRHGAALLPTLLASARALGEPQLERLDRHCLDVVTADPDRWHSAVLLVAMTTCLHSHFGQPGPVVDSELTALTKIHVGAWGAGAAMLLTDRRPFMPGTVPALLAAPWILAGLELPTETR